MVCYNCALNTIALVFCLWSAVLHIALRSHVLNLYHPPQTSRPPHCQPRTEKTEISRRESPPLFPSALKAASPTPILTCRLGGSSVVVILPPFPSSGTPCHQVSLVYLSFLFFSFCFIYLDFQLFLSLLAFQPGRMLKSSHSKKESFSRPYTVSSHLPFPANCLHRLLAKQDFLNFSSLGMTACALSTEPSVLLCI